MNPCIVKAFDFIDQNRENIIDDLKSLVKIPSISVAGKDGFPYSKEVNDALLRSAELYSKFGFEMQVKSEDGYAIYTSDGKGDGIGVFSHADVVPVNDDWVKTSPFEPICENGILYGRGVGDNKAGIICALYALAALKSAQIFPKNKITAYVGGSEETGLQDIEIFVKKEKMPLVNIVPDTDFPVSLGEKGIIHIDCRSKQPFDKITRFDGGNAYNVVLDRLKFYAEDLKENLPSEFLPCDNGEFEIKGLTAHAAYPEGSENAAYKAASLLKECDFLSQNDKKILSSFARAIYGYYGENLGIKSSGAFGNLTCSNGIVKVLQDKTLFFTLDIRYGNEISGEAIKNSTKEKLNALGFDLVSFWDDEGFLLPQDSKQTEAILQSCREVCDRPDAIPYLTFGGTYARKLSNAYAINHSAPFDVSTLNLPIGHGGPHQSDEALSVDALILGIKTLASILFKLDESL